MSSASPPARFAARGMHPDDLPEAIALAAGCGAHGVYARNFLAAADPARLDADVLAFHADEGLVGLACFGRRGNLIVLERQPLDPEKAARAIAASGYPWRIALGSPELIRGLAVREVHPPVVDREQLYYAVRPADVPPALVDPGRVRRATRQDQTPLMDATLELNRLDLNVDPRRVSAGWLRRSVRQRIRDGSTWVLGPEAAPLSKLDVGSRGPGGVVLEGVYTWEHARGQGLAPVLVATVAAQAGRDCPLVCLHVAADNLPAHRAYERAGMRRVARVRLLLRG